MDKEQAKSFLEGRIGFKKPSSQKQEAIDTGVTTLSRQEIVKAVENAIAKGRNAPLTTNPQVSGTFEENQTIQLIFDEGMSGERQAKLELVYMPQEQLWDVKASVGQNGNFQEVRQKEFDAGSSTALEQGLKRFILPGIVKAMR